MISLQNLPTNLTMSIERLIPYLARTIKKRREQLGLSCDDLAQATGFSAEYIQFIETGGNNFAMTTLKTIAEGLRMAPSQLIRSAEELLDKDGKS